MVSKCPLCSWFAAKCFKGVLRHMGTCHAHDPSFYVVCNFDGCPQIYSNFLSYKKHVYMKHRELLGLSSLSQGSNTSNELDFDDYSGSDSECEDVQSVYSRKKRAAALFVLKSKHVYKVSQTSLDGLMNDFTSMITSTVHYLEKELTDHVDPQLKLKIKEIFHSKEVLDPFCGLTSQYKQKAYFKENFHSVVSE